jgi:hypothetical protein
MIQNNQNIDKYLKDQKWYEVIKLYSGLFDEESDRSKFIVDTSEFDLLLAAECSQDSITKNEKLDNIILQKAKTQFELISVSDLGRTYEEFVSVLLIKPLNKEIIRQFFNSDAFKKRRYFKQTNDYLLNYFSFEDIMEFIFGLNQGEKNLFLKTILKSSYKRLLNSGDYDKINSLLSAMLHLGYNPYGVLDSLKGRRIKIEKNLAVLEFIKKRYSNPIKRKYMNINTITDKLVLIFSFNRHYLINYFNDQGTNDI